MTDDWDGLVEKAIDWLRRAPLSDVDFDDERALTQQEGAKKKGLTDRLKSHASGRRSGDQFCLYVCDRLVLPHLSSDDVQQVGVGRLSLDERTKRFIHENLTYRFAIVPDGEQAFRLVLLCQIRSCTDFNASMRLR